MKIRIGMASLYNIAEKACRAYKQELVEAENMFEANCLVDSLADVMRLCGRWEDPK